MDIIQTLPGDSNFHLFEQVPKILYAPDSSRLKETESLNLEFLKACFVLIQDDEPKARLALYENPHLNYKGKKSACIGNYECVDSKEISDKIISHVIRESQKGEAKYLIGPMNGSTWDNYRFSTHNNLTNFLLEPYHHAYYNEHFKKAGFQPISHYISSKDQTLNCDSPEVLKIEKELTQKGVRLRSIDLTQFENELKKLFPFISSSFQTNFLYTPISWETFRKKYLEAHRIINPEFFLIAEDAQNNIIGLIFCYPDLFNLKEKSLVVKTLARDASKQWSGLGHVLFNHVVKSAKKSNFTSMVHAFMYDHGTSTGVSSHFSGEIFKNYILYGKDL